jgi:hypothetical protein
MVLVTMLIVLNSADKLAFCFLTALTAACALAPKKATPTLSAADQANWTVSGRPRRSARSLSPWIGWVPGQPCLTLRTCKAAELKSN